MARITKGMISAALFQLEGICDLASEAHAYDNSGLIVLRNNADSASRYLDTLHKADVELPARITAKRQMLTQCGWRLPYQPKGA